MTSPVIANLHSARFEVSDADAYRQMRMEDSFMHVPVFDAFDAVLSLPQTSVSEEA